MLQGLPVDFEGFSSIGILLVPFLRAIYFFFSGDVVQAQTDRENITLLGRRQQQQEEEEEEAFLACSFPSYFLLLRSFVLLLLPSSLLVHRLEGSPLAICRRRPILILRPSLTSRWTFLRHLVHDTNGRVEKWKILNQQEFACLCFLSCYRSFAASLKKTKKELCAFGVWSFRCSY